MDTQKLLSLLCMSKSSNSNVYEIIHSKRPIPDITKEAIQKSKNIQKICANKNIKIIGYFDPEYPNALKKINYAPVILYAIGKLELLNKSNTLSITGNRLPSEKGILNTHKVVDIMKKYNLTLVGGLSIGIDTQAQRKFIETKVNSIAVIASPLDEIYPQSKQDLLKTILKKDGCVISAISPKTAIKPRHLSERDKLQASISNGLIIIETEKNSGITQMAKYAIANNIKCACINYTIFDKYNEGNKELINSGAYPINEDSDIEQFFSKLIYQDFKEYAV